MKSTPDSYIFLSPFPWHGAWQTTHYFAHHLACEMPVLYVEAALSWYPTGSNHAIGPLFRGVLGMRPRRIEPKLDIWTPRSLPFSRWSAIDRYNRRAYRRGLAECCRALGYKEPHYLVFYYEGCFDDVKDLPGKYTYFCLDYFEHGNHAEEACLARNASQVLASSRPLLERLEPYNAAVHLVPSGVELEWFGETPRGAAAADLGKRQRRPRIGFVGLINRYIDIELLLMIAGAIPEADVVLVGPVRSGTAGPDRAQRACLDALKGLPNVSLLGFRPASALARHIAEFDVCLLPYIMNDKVWHSDPLKIYQYFALGKPVVTQSWPALSEYAHLFYPVLSRDQWTTQIRRALDEPSCSPAAEARRDLARGRDWRLLTKRAHALVQAQYNTFDG
jgi:hypothetical protein